MYYVELVIGWKLKITYSLKKYIEDLLSKSKPSTKKSIKPFTSSEYEKGNEIFLFSDKLITKEVLQNIQS